MTGTVDLMVMNLHNAVALDFDWLEKKVYWSDVTSTGSNITRMSIDNPNEVEVSKVTYYRVPTNLEIWGNSWDVKLRKSQEKLESLKKWNKNQGIYR